MAPRLKVDADLAALTPVGQQLYRSILQAHGRGTLQTKLDEILHYLDESIGPEPIESRNGDWIRQKVEEVGTELEDALDAQDYAPREDDAREAGFGRLLLRDFGSRIKQHRDSNPGIRMEAVLHVYLCAKEWEGVNEASGPTSEAYRAVTVGLDRVHEKAPGLGLTIETIGTDVCGACLRAPHVGGPLLEAIAIFFHFCLTLASKLGVDWTRTRVAHGLGAKNLLRKLPDASNFEVTHIYHTAAYTRSACNPDTKTLILAIELATAFHAASGDQARVKGIRAPFAHAMSVILTSVKAEQRRSRTFFGDLSLWPKVEEQFWRAVSDDSVELERQNLASLERALRALPTKEDSVPTLKRENERLQEALEQAQFAASTYRNYLMWHGIAMPAVEDSDFNPSEPRVLTQAHLDQLRIALQASQVSLAESHLKRDPSSQLNSRPELAFGGDAQKAMRSLFAYRRPSYEPPLEHLPVMARLAMMTYKRGAITRLQLRLRVQKLFPGLKKWPQHQIMGKPRLGLIHILQHQFCFWSEDRPPPKVPRLNKPPRSRELLQWRVEATIALQHVATPIFLNVPRQVDEHEDEDDDAEEVEDDDDDDEDDGDEGDGAGGARIGGSATTSYVGSAGGFRGGNTHMRGRGRGLGSRGRGESSRGRGRGSRGRDESSRGRGQGSRGVSQNPTRGGQSTSFRVGAARGRGRASPFSSRDRS